MPGELTRAQALVFEDEVRKIRTEVLTQDVPPLEAFEMFDVETDVPIGAQEFGSDMITQFGDVAVLSNNSDDLRYAEVGIYRSTHKVISIGNAYKWTYMEAVTATLTGKIPRRLRGVAARDIMLQNLNDIIIDGKQEYGVEGFLTFPGVPRHTMSVQFVTGDTADNMLAALFDLLMRPITATKGVSKPTHMWLPLDKFLLISVTARGTNNDTTVLEFFQKQARGILGYDLIIKGSWMMEASNKCAVWRKGEAASSKAVIPGNMRFTQLNPQQINYEFRVPCLAITGGWYTEYPLRACIGEFT